MAFPKLPGVPVRTTAVGQVKVKGTTDPFNLAAVADLFPDAMADRSRGELPPGRYSVVVDSVVLGMTKAGAPMLTWHLQVREGTFEGRIIYKNSTFGSAKAVTHALTDLEISGVSIAVQDLPTIPDRLGELERVPLIINLRTTEDGNTSVYIVGIDYSCELAETDEGAPPNIFEDTRSDDEDEDE